jgi:chemosensory pili system protein ChpA (sensor histidine kinase/response regulator)
MLDTPVSPPNAATGAAPGAASGAHGSAPTAAPLSYDDLSALAWVSGELRRSLEAAHKALRRHLKDAEAGGVGGKGDLDALDLAVLRTAKNQIHQGVGALELVGLPAAADALRAAEVLVQKMVSKPAHATRAAVLAVERVSFALLDLLGRQLAGKPVSPVVLFPQVQAALQLAGSDRIHPADLWKLNWQWQTLPADPSAKPRKTDEAARGDMEQLVLALMREPGHAAHTRMGRLCAGLGAGAARLLEQQNLATVWQLAAAVFEALALGLLENDVHTKRLGSRLLAQLRMATRGQTQGLAQASDRLAQDLLFFCSHARAPAQLGLSPKDVPRLTAVCQVWQLDQLPTADYTTARLGLFDPAQVSLARRRVAAAKDTWAAVAGGEQHRITSLNEQFALVGDSLQKLFPAGDVLATSLSQAANQAVTQGTAPEPAVAMEVATAMLYLDAALEDGEFDQPDLPARVLHLAQRIDAVHGGAAPQPLALWMEDLYRRVSDRQTMGSVVQELRASLSVIEKQIDAYFRNPADRSVLIPVPAQLSSMRGVFSVLGLTQASHAVLHMRDGVDALAHTVVDTQQAIQTGTFDHLADNLGALSFLIDMLSVQPKLAKSLFRFDASTGSLSAVMGQAERVSAFAGLDDLAAAATLPVPLPEAPAPAQPTLLAGIEALASAAGRADVSDAHVVQQLEQLAPQAAAADQTELARLLGHAQNELGGSTSPAASRALRSELAEAVTGLSTQAGRLAEPAPPPSPVPAPKVAPAGGTGLEDDAELREIFIEAPRRRDPRHPQRGGRDDGHTPRLPHPQRQRPHGGPA